MNKTLLALSAAALLAGTAGSASAQYYPTYGGPVYEPYAASAYADWDRDGVPNRYDRYDNRGYISYDSRLSDRDCDGIPDRVDQNDRASLRDMDCDGIQDWNDPYDDRVYQAVRSYSAPRYYAPASYSYGTRWDVGTRMPDGYYDVRYGIDYRPYGLSAPPYGYRWSRVGSDAYLVNVTNGLIAEAVYSLFR